MRLIRLLAASAMILSFASAGMAAETPDHAMTLQLVRGGGGGHGGGGFGGHFGGFHGGYAMHGGHWGYHPWHGRNYGYGLYPYGYTCPYPYNYNSPYCAYPG